MTTAGNAEITEEIGPSMIGTSGDQNKKAFKNLLCELGVLGGELC
jgi:hypothetical protein